MNLGLWPSVAGDPERALCVCGQGKQEGVGWGHLITLRATHHTHHGLGVSITVSPRCWAHRQEPLSDSGGAVGGKGAQERLRKQELKSGRSLPPGVCQPWLHLLPHQAHCCER